MVPLDKFVDRVVASGILSASLCEFPAPAALHDIETAEVRLGQKLPESLRSLLSRWNGANLDVLRLVACEGMEMREEGLYFANDPAGFMYFLDSSGAVVMLDTDGGGLRAVASDPVDLLTGYVFGARAREFAGEEWAQEIKAAGLAT
jgi:hypothetical protein